MSQSQMNCQRQVTFYTPQKTYSGFVDINTSNIRTIDLLNSANLYWKDPAEKSFSDSIMLNRAAITIEGGRDLGSFPQLQMRLADIIFFTDNEDSAGDFTEKIRATTLKNKNGDQSSVIRVLTRMNGDAFYIITGKFKGLFKSKSRNRYLPIAEATVNAVIRTGDSWKNIQIISEKFIGLSTNHIEACTFH